MTILHDCLRAKFLFLHLTLKGFLKITDYSFSCELCIFTLTVDIQNPLSEFEDIQWQTFMKL